MKNLWFERGAYASTKARTFLAEHFSPEKIRHVAVIRHAALGDQVITRPFLVELRKFLPNAKITLVGVSNYQYGLPSDLVDSVIIMAGKEKTKSMSLRQKFRDFCQLEEQDIIFDLANTSRSQWMVLLSKAKLKMGFPYRQILNGPLYNIGILRSDFKPEIECMLDMLKILGHVPARPLDFALPSNVDVNERDKTKILYFNGASTTTKIISTALMRTVIEDAMQALPHYEHVFLEGKNKTEKGDYLTDLVKEGQFSIQTCLPLDELSNVCSKAKLLVSPDTGVRNLAIATHTSTVGIFYSTVPFRYTPQEAKHSIVLKPNGDIPSANNIVNAIITQAET